MVSFYEMCALNMQQAEVWFDKYKKQTFFSMRKYKCTYVLCNSVWIAKVYCIVQWNATQKIDGVLAE